MLAPHPDYNLFKSKLQRLLGDAISFKGVLYRACEPMYANTRDLLTGEGSRKTGGRWNPPRAFAITYLAQSLEGAVAESLGVTAHFGFDPSSRLPLTLVALDASLHGILDFSNAKTRKAIGVSVTAMLDCDWRRENHRGAEALTQALGRAAFDLGVEAIIVPSAVKRTLANVNVFWANLRTSSILKIRSAEKLPPPP